MKLFRKIKDIFGIKVYKDDNPKENSKAENNGDSGEKSENNKKEKVYKSDMARPTVKLDISEENFGRYLIKILIDEDTSGLIAFGRQNKNRIFVWFKNSEIEEIMKRWYVAAENFQKNGSETAYYYFLQEICKKYSQQENTEKENIQTESKKAVNDNLEIPEGLIVNYLMKILIDKDKDMLIRLASYRGDIFLEFTEENITAVLRDWYALLENLESADSGAAYDNYIRELCKKYNLKPLEQKTSADENELNEEYGVTVLPKDTA